MTFYIKIKNEKVLVFKSVKFKTAFLTVYFFDPIQVSFVVPISNGIAFVI